MSVNMGQAIGYLDLDTSKFKTGLKSALADLKTFQSQSATTKDKMAALSSAATSAGRSLTKGLTVPLVGIGAASVAVTAKFDAGMSKVQAVSGATGKELDKLRDKAKEMGAKTKFSATQSAEAFNYMAMAGWKTEDMLNGIEGIMNLAAASGEDLATTSDIVTDALTAFGLSAADSAHFADVLAANSSNANTNVAMLGESFKYCAPVAGALGYSVEDVNLALGLMANSGIKASQSGTTLRGALTRLAKPTGEVKKAMEEYGVSLTDVNGEMLPLRDVMSQLREKFSSLSKAEQAQAATTLFGKNAMSGMLAIINSSDKDWNKLANAIDNADGTAEKMAETMMDNLPGAITLAKSALEGLGIRIGEVMTPAITKVVKVFTSFISWLSQASDSTVKFAVGMGVVLASIGPVLLITGHLAGSIVNLMNVYQALSKVLAGKTVASFVKAAAAKAKDMAMTVADTVAQMRYQAALHGMGGTIKGAISRVLALAAAHKIAAGAALGIVGAVVGLIIYMKKTGTSVDELKDKIMNMFNNLVSQVPEIMSTVSEVASGIVKQIPTIIAGALTSLGTIVSTGLSNLKTALPEIAKWWSNDMPQLIKVGSDMVVNVINGFSESLPDLINTGSDMLVQLIDQFFAEAPKFIDAGLQIILSIIEGMSQAIPQLVANIGSLLTANIGPIISKITTVLSLIIQAIIKNLPVILQAIVTIVTSIVSALAASAPQILAAALKLMLALVAGIIKSLPQILVALGKIALAIVQAIVSITGSMIQAGVKILQALWRGISSWAGTLGSKLLAFAKTLPKRIKKGIGNLISIGSKWLAGLWNGAKGKASSALSSALQFAKQLPKKIKSGLGSLFSVGANFIQGLWNGMKGKLNSAISWAKNKVSALPKAVKKVLGIGSPSVIMHQYGEWFIKGFEDGMKAAFNPVLDLAENQMSDLLKAYTNMDDYEFGFNINPDTQLADAIGGLSSNISRPNQNMTFAPNITVQGTENPEHFATALIRQFEREVRM